MERSKLRIGLLLGDYNISAWSFKMIENIAASRYAEIVLVIMNDNKKAKPNTTPLSKLRNNRGRLMYLMVRRVLEILYSGLIERKTYLPDATKRVNCEALLGNIPTIKVKTVQTKRSDYFQDGDIKTIREHNLDILVRCGFGILRGAILGSAKYGIWSYHHGDNRINRGGPSGFWESMENWNETGSILHILTEDLDNGKVLYRSYTRTATMSVKDNKSRNLWRSVSFMTRKMEELYNVGGEAFFEKVADDNRHPAFYSRRLYTKPTNAELAKLTFDKIKQKTRALYYSEFYLNQWILMFHLNNTFSSSLWRYKKLIPPKDRFWADPHVMFRDGKYYIFIEEYIYKTRQGHISVIVMDERGIHSAPEIVLATPDHLSYPFVFEHERECYMIPESIATKTVGLYRCLEFPHKWELQMNLMENVRAVDATVVFHKGKWWLFANIVESDGGSTCDELFLFSSRDLVSDRWQSHPLNPIVSDCKRSRPAGKIFSHDGRLYRPSQNCSTRYGYGFNVSEIVALDEANYAEVLVSSVTPGWDKNILGTHTFNRVNRLHVIDALYRRRR